MQIIRQYERYRRSSSAYEARQACRVLPHQTALVSPATPAPLLTTSLPPAKAVHICTEYVHPHVSEHHLTAYLVPHTSFLRPGPACGVCTYIHTNPAVLVVTLPPFPCIRSISPHKHPTQPPYSPNNSQPAFLPFPPPSSVQNPCLPAPRRRHTPAVCGARRGNVAVGSSTWHYGAGVALWRTAVVFGRGMDACSIVSTRQRKEGVIIDPYRIGSCSWVLLHSPKCSLLSSVFPSPAKYHYNAHL